MQQKEINGERSGGLLKNAIEENAIKLQELSNARAQKIAELSKVQQELNELNMLYLGDKRKE